MLRTFAYDLVEAGHEVTVFLDSRISKINPPINAQHVVPVSYAAGTEKLLVATAKVNDAIYVIAPETRQTLQSLVRLMESTGKVSLNCKSDAVGKVSDKTSLSCILKKEDLNSPKSMVFNFKKELSEVKAAIRKTLSYPLIVKPVEGISCSGLSIVKEVSQVEAAIARAQAHATGKQFIVQTFVKGEAASVSVLCGKGGAMAISLNKQNIQLANPETVSSYEGGVVPFDHPMKQEAFKTAEKLVSSIAGLRGYVGVDLILGDEPWIVDLNPRLTTSYVGISRVSDFNLGDAVVNAVVKNQYPAKKEEKGFAYFLKVETSKPTASSFQMATQINEVISPPFPLGNIPSASALIAGQGTTLDEAKMQFEETKKRLLDIINRGR